MVAGPERDRQLPIGVFDSGFGGLTVVRAIMDLLPNEAVFYIGDTGRYPYGPRPLEDVYRFATEILSDWSGRMLDSPEGWARRTGDYQVKLIVVGCNSACSALWSLGRPRLPVPMLGVIDPPARTAARLTRNGRVGVIGTEATVRAGQYDEALRRTGRPMQIVSRACPPFVHLVEEGETSGPRVEAIVEEQLAAVKAAGVDTLILGCTHYPLLQDVIATVMGPEVMLVSSAQEVARDVWTVLEASNLARPDGEPPVHEFLTSGDKENFLRLGRRFLGPELDAVSGYRTREQERPDQRRPRRWSRAGRVS